MVKWGKTLISAVVILTFLSGTLSGCGKKAGDTNSNQAAADEISIKVDGNFNSTGLPIMKKPITLKMLTYNFGGKSFSEKTHFKQMSEETNVFIEWEEVERTVFNDRLNLAISSSDLPDALYAAPLQNYADAVESKMIIPLDDYINKFAPNQKKMLELYPSVRMASTYTGDNKIYVYAGAGVKPEAKVRAPIFMNKVWLERLGLKAPTTLDEFYNVLKAFKTKDPNGNGVADEIPLIGLDIYKDWLAVWGMIDVKTKFHTSIKDGKLIFNPTDIRYKDALSYLHKLYEEGLLDNESFSYNAQKLVANGSKKPAIYGAFDGYDIETTIGTANAAEYDVILPLKGPNGDRLWPYNPSELDVYRGLTIFKDCKYPEAAIRWVDHLNDGVNSIKTVIGPENFAWKRDESKKTWQTLEGELKKQGLAIDNAKKDEGTQNGAEMYKIDQITGYKWVGDPESRDYKKQLWSEAYAPFLNKETWPSGMPISPSTPESKEIDELVRQFEAYLTPFIKDVIINGQADQKWDEHLKKCRDLQVDRVVSFYQKAYEQIQKIQKK